MKLLRYKVVNFRSIEDSGWIECDNVTTLVGVNESGKTNLLLALWKFNPASSGNIDYLHDMPVDKLVEFRDKQSMTPFIITEFLLDSNDDKSISEIVPCEGLENNIIQIKRYYDGNYSIDFTKNKPIEVENARQTDEKPSDKSFEERLNFEIINKLPKFVYYSNYGNLSSRIYLPYAIKWINNQQVAGIDIKEDQVRTLRVLFKYVGLDPQEILDLGSDLRRANTMPADALLKKSAANIEQRSILLQSASRKLTNDFKNWWKQGTYRFRFEADGEYFQIYVSDDKRSEEVSLDLRSTGLQWFLSFYLIFLVESQREHRDAILLLDEAGLTLHPLAQKDLRMFFESLSKTNPIINTTHSPFIVDTNNIDKCRVVYVDKNGKTVVSSDLRKNDDPSCSQSIYALHAALGLSVSNVLLEGCNPVVVEGTSDQHYLNAIKLFLIHENLISPKNEILFVPAGGVKGISPIISLLGIKDELPCVVLDSDGPGLKKAEALKNNLYATNSCRVIVCSDINKMQNSEIEDLIPEKLVDKYINKLFQDIDEEFSTTYNETIPIVPQIEKFADDNSVKLEMGWKVDLAKAFKKSLASCNTQSIDQKYTKYWMDLFSKIQN